MAKTKDVVVKTKKGGSRADLLKVSREVKIIAAFATLRGFSMRKTIRSLGEAEDNFKKNGRLVFGG